MESFESRQQASQFGGCPRISQPFIEESWSSEQLLTFIRLASEATRRISQRESFTATELESWDILEGEGIFPRGEQIINTAAIVELGELSLLSLKANCQTLYPEEYGCSEREMADRQYGSKLS